MWQHGRTRALRMGFLDLESQHCHQLVVSPWASGTTARRLIRENEEEEPFIHSFIHQRLVEHSLGGADNGNGGIR